MSRRSTIAVADVLVWQGQGLVQVEGQREMNGKSLWVMKSVETGMTMMIPSEALNHVVRRPVSRPDAKRLADLLRQQTGRSDDRPWPERFHAAMVTLIKRPLEAQVNALHTLYRTPYALTFGERKLIDTFERLVVAELAHVLGTSLDAMVAELRSGQPAFATGSPPRPPDPEVATPEAPIVLEDHSYLGKLSSPSGKIVVGEARAPAEDTFLAEGKPGVWHAYVREASDDDAGALVLIHADALETCDELLEKLVAVAEVAVEGGTMAMICAEVRDDDDFQEATMFPVGPIVQGSGCIVRTDGDGAHPLRGAKIADRYTVLVVDF